MVNYDDESLILTAKTHIQIGEELTYNYGYMDEILCRCGSPKCSSKQKYVEILENLDF